MPDERDEGMLEHRLACLVMPLLLAERGDLALHAAVLARDGRAVAFCGASMRGKSTLAAELAARGYALLGDDSAVLSLDGDDGHARLARAVGLAAAPARRAGAARPRPRSATATSRPRRCGSRRRSS